jgi:hypothetical protein
LIKKLLERKAPPPVENSLVEMPENLVDITPVMYHQEVAVGYFQEMILCAFLPPDDPYDPD